MARKRFHGLKKVVRNMQKLIDDMRAYLLTESSCDME
jgi:hypothetical protein